MGYRILIVDDSSVTRAVLKKTIGMVDDVPVEEIFEADNGTEALALLSHQQVDLIFADLNMPEMDGMELTTHIFTQMPGATAPAIIVVTTEASSARVARLLAKGVKGYVHKPFTPESIRDALLDVLPVNSGVNN